MDKFVKNQHYVPQFYLKHFVNQNGEVERLNCNLRKILAPKGPKGICCEDFYYGAETGKEDKLSQDIEKFFSGVENELAPKINAIIPKILDFKPISNTDKYDIAILMSVMWVRGPDMRDRINSMAADMIKQLTAFTFSVKPGLLDEIDAKVDWKKGDDEVRKKCREAVLSGDFDVRVDNTQHMTFFSNIEGFANLFYGQDWLVYVLKEGGTFITTDNPVSTHIPDSKGFYGPTFLERTHYFALSPKICIVGRYPNVKNGLKLHRKTLFSKDKKQTFDLNLKIGRFAHQYVYSNEQNNLNEILKLLNIKSSLAEKKLRLEILRSRLPPELRAQL